jgi:hypothetical protein
VEARKKRVGDIVLRKDETAAGQTYKYAKVIRVQVSSDGKVRAADIEYKLPGESVFRTTTRPIHKLVLVIPVAEQGPMVDQAGGPEAGPSQATPSAGGLPAPARVEAVETTAVAPLEADPQVARQTEPEVKEGEGLAEAATPPPQNGIGVAQPGPNPGERVSGERGDRRVQAIIVAAPK